MPIANPPNLKIFISSPGDVAAERAVIRQVIERVDASLPGLTLEPYFSEDDLYFASHGPQEHIPLASEFDLVVCLFWKRMGTRLLPERFNATRGRTRTGSEFEFETAVEAARKHAQHSGAPVPGVLVYRNTRPIAYSADKVDEERAQHQSLEAFFERWIKDAEGHYLGYAHRFTSSEQLERVFERHLRDWIAMQRRAADWDVGTRGSPYRGLDVFEREHADVYFGRDRAILEACARMKAGAEAGFPVLWLVGASGSGKSSLMRAGVAPRLERSEGGLCSLIFRPSELGSDLASGLAEKLLAALPELQRGSFPDAATLRSVLAVDDPTPAVHCLQTALGTAAQAEAQRCGWSDTPRMRLLIGIDQAEELLTQRSPAERQHLVRLLHALLAADQLWLMLSFRSDFYALMQRDGDLTPLKATAQQLDIATPSAAEFAEMIESPARAAGLTLEVREDGRALRDELCTDATGPDSLPMLQFALRALHEQAIARGDHVLRLRDYKAMGRAAGALSHAAEASLQVLPANVQAAFPTLLRELVDLNLQSSSRAPTAQNASLSHFADDSAAQALIAALVERRLLTQFDVAGEAQLRVVHESLFNHWPRAQQQIVEDARRLDARRRLIDAHALWCDADSKRAKNNRVLTGFALQEGLDLVRAWGLPDQLRNFVRESERAALRQRRNLKIGVAALALATLMAAGMSWMASRQRDAARQADAASKTTLQQAAKRALGRAEERLLEGNLTDSAAYLAESLSYGEVDGAVMHASMALQQMTPLVSLHQWQHEGLAAAQFSPDGTRVVTGIADGVAHLLDARTGAALGEPLRHKESVHYAQFSPDGTRLVTIGHAVSLWDPRSGVALGELPTSEVGRDTFAQFSPDGMQLVTAGADNTARLWDARTGVAQAEPMRHKGAVVSAEFSPDGTQVVTAGYDNTARLWDARTGVAQAEPMRHKGDVVSAEFSPDGTRVVTASRDNTARLWDAHTGAALGEPMRHEADLNSAEFSPDGTRVLTASPDNTARLWDGHTGAALGESLLHEVGVIDAHFSPDGTRVITIGGGVRLWDARSGLALGKLPGGTNVLTSVQFSPDGSQVIGSSYVYDISYLWDVRTGVALGVPLRHKDFVRDAQFSPEGVLVVTGSSDNTAQLWDARTGTAQGEPLRHKGDVWSAQFCPDGSQVVTVSNDGNYVVRTNAVQLWDVRTGTSSGEPLWYEGWRVARSPDCTRLVTAASSTVQVWDARTGAALGTPFRHFSTRSVEFSPNGAQLVTASWDDKTAQVWDARTGVALGAPLRHGGGINYAEFSPDGTRVVTASWDETAQIWDARTGAPLGEPLRRGASVESAQFSPDGTRVVTVSLSSAQLMDARIGAPLGAPMQHEDKVNSAQFSPGGARVVTASWDNTARIWDAHTGAALGPPLRHKGDVWSARFSPDGTRVVTASNDGTARLWDARPDLDAEPSEYISALQFLSGKRVAGDGRLVFIDNEDVIKWRDDYLAHTPTNTDFDHLIRWHFADRATRTISPFSELTVPEHIEREIDWALAHHTPKILNDAYNLNPAHPLILFAMSVFEDRPETKALWKRLSFPRIANDARLAARAAEILQQDNDPENAKKAAEIALSLAPDNAKAKAVLVWANSAIAKRGD